MRSFQYVKDFEKLGFGMFVHFGIYSIAGKGEWYRFSIGKKEQEAYDRLPEKFRVKKNWAKDLVAVAKKAGCRYITLTTRHHDGFSLYDTCGLNDFDAPHSATGRDLVREFVDACREVDILPFFYHTLLDWHHPDYDTNFPAYIDYLIKSVELLCKNYGKIGGLWFDGMWNKPDADWQEDRLYATIRRYQPEAMIINNTGLPDAGKIGHFELDSVTFERGKPFFVDNSDRPRAGEMCQIFNDHWGYAENDIHYKPMEQILGDLLDCRYYGCNFLLNIGPMKNGDVRPYDKCMLEAVGQWIKANKGFLYHSHAADITAENAQIFVDDNGKYYAAIKGVITYCDPNVSKAGTVKEISIPGKKIKSVRWLDNGRAQKHTAHTFLAQPFPYGISLCIRVAEIVFETEEK